MPLTYHEQVKINNIQKVRELTKDFPAFTGDFFRAIENTKQSNTVRGYAYDLSTFFYFLQTNNPYFRDHDIRSLPVSILDQIQPVDIEEYLSFLSYYEKDGKTYTNQEEGKARKLASLNTFFGYYHKKQYITTNAPAAVDIPKVKDKNIIRLEPDEITKLIDSIESGENLTDRQKAWHVKQKIRDLAIIVTLLGTGIRVTELVGLDLTDINFDNGAMKLIRKGGNEDIVYFGEEVDKFLQEYMDERIDITPEKGHENALFISRNNIRITVRSVERLVKKYAGPTISKHITPHKMRSTYGTSLYHETGDIYLVADVLGHKNVNTTKRRYTAMTDDRKRSAANVVKLRGGLHNNDDT